MSFAAACSEHPIPAQATGEVVGELHARLGAEPDLALLFLTEHHVPAASDVVEVVSTVLRPRVLLGATAVSVVGGTREIEERPGISLWAAQGLGDVQPLRLRGGATAEIPFPGAGAEALLLLSDPFSLHVERLLESIDATQPGLPAVGGMASAGRGPGGNRLLLGTEVFDDGAVGALLPPGTRIETVVSQGCRPIGDPYVVTRSDRNVIHELAGLPALARLARIAESLEEEDRALVSAGLHIGMVVDERLEVFSRGDFLIRGVIGADRSSGALVVGEEVPVGTTVQFQVRDAASADADLRELLAGKSAEAALLFTCNGRGQRMFGVPDHDAALVSTAAGSSVAGMFCAGEIGPIGGRNYVQGFTASVALFRDASE